MRLGQISLRFPFILCALMVAAYEVDITREGASTHLNLCVCGGVCVCVEGGPLVPPSDNMNSKMPTFHDKLE